ncbi:chondroitin AC/alginate lyase [Leucosporidium creatinivorum]|uniref:Chondroitin AC/alginate lyase n=1 Tax=Leucosporidium creatinivorum TaxID=106004 RepID=A0A1Y2ESK7_9BASI|nr:chondroitin AC/alginate lyase [Leucosporidium creatinivorum]
MYRQSNDSQQRPLANVDYSAAGTHEPKYGGYGSGYNSKGAPQPKSSKKRLLWIIAAIVAVIVIVGAVVGGVVGSRAAKDSNKSAESNGDSGSGSGASGASGNGATATKGSGKNAVKPTATDQYGNPQYPTSTGSAKIAAPAFTTNDSLSCGSDPYSFGTSDSLTVRKEHPLLFAPSYKWECLPKLIAQDSYMSYWNDTIFANATKFYDTNPTNYSIDGCLSCSGVLDVAREVQLKIKHWGYAYKISNDTKWADRAWRELETAAGNTSQAFGTTGDNWNTAHFLDVGEFLTAFAIGYDWFYDAWTETQRTALMWSIIELGLQKGLNAYADPDGEGANYHWWTTVNGNWNCVCNNGLIVGALAIANEDPTGIAARVLEYAVANAADNCAMSPSNDGTWSETANYWYFGTTGHVQMTSALLSATGSTHNLLDSNPGMKLSGLYHMYVTGHQGLFNYGDCGPNKFVATANALLFYGSQYDMPEYTLFQRDRGDAPEPMSMLYYDPQVTGQFWQGLALDYHFTNNTDSWVSMRSSWTDNDGVYVAMKSGVLTGHQTHGDLDGGDFVLDALGQRWAGELGNGDYLSEGYFSNENQDSDRWKYFRKASEGQNTLIFDGLNQNVAGLPTTAFDSTGEKQDALVYTPANSSTALFTTTLTTFYNDTTTAKRGIRLLNGRRQVLLQDEVDTTVAVEWRMFTNATVTLSNNDRTATLALGGQTLIATLQEPSGASFAVTADPTRTSSLGALPSGQVDQPNDGVSLLTIAIAAGTNTIAVLFNPQYEGVSADTYITPASVALDSWTLTSHD